MSDIKVSPVSLLRFGNGLDPNFSQRICDKMGWKDPTKPEFPVLVETKFLPKGTIILKRDGIPVAAAGNQHGYYGYTGELDFSKEWIAAGCWYEWVSEESKWKLTLTGIPLTEWKNYTASTC